jgi:hypothetical protein
MAGTARSSCSSVSCGAARATMASRAAVSAKGLHPPSTDGPAQPERCVAGRPQSRGAP